MRKALAILIMIGVCSMYFLAMKNRGVVEGKESLGVSFNIEGEMNERIKEISTGIDEVYPQTPKDLIEVINDIMKVQYSEQLELEGNLERETLLGLCKLYSQKLLDLNPYEKQLENLRLELITNHTEGIYLVESRIESIKFVTPNDALVEVFYKTTKGTRKREYTLVKEERLWKIYSWKDFE